MNVVTTQSNMRWLEEVDSAVFGDPNDFSLMLTGGRSAKKLYDHWLKMDWFSSYNIDCYFGDERCVLPDSLESNYGMVMNTLFVEGVPDGSRVHRMKGEQVDFEREAARYASILPDSIDVLLLSVGEDGHIASIFPGSEVLYDETSPVRHIHAPKPPAERLTITPKVLKSAKKIVVLACGSEKGKVVAEALKQPSTTQELPITLVFGESKTTIILDKEGSEQLQ
jgi:6-phosphogluconolactonase